MTVHKAGVVKTAPPAGLLIEALMPRWNFRDSYRRRLSAPGQGASPVLLAQRIFSRTPAWVDRLMDLRNAAMRRLGLKDVGRLGQPQPEQLAVTLGDRIGPFTVYAHSDTEVVFGEKDRHLDVFISVSRWTEGDETAVYVTTSVVIHNLLGRLYMLVVGPAHRVIAPAVLRAAVL